VLYYIEGNQEDKLDLCIRLCIR